MLSSKAQTKKALRTQLKSCSLTGKMLFLRVPGLLLKNDTVFPFQNSTSLPLTGSNSMAVTITYFVHGTTLDNQNDISSGWSDAELSDLGIKQSVELWDKITHKQFDVVFCSDLKRAVDSAKLTFENRVPVIQDTRLRE